MAQDAPSPSPSQASDASDKPASGNKRGAPDSNNSNAPQKITKRRAARACVSCRARKVRCDVVEGAPCGNCRWDNVEVSLFAIGFSHSFTHILFIYFDFANPLTVHCPRKSSTQVSDLHTSPLLRAPVRPGSPPRTCTPIADGPSARPGEWPPAPKLHFPESMAGRGLGARGVYCPLICRTTWHCNWVRSLQSADRTCRKNLVTPSAAGPGAAEAQQELRSKASDSTGTPAGDAQCGTSAPHSPDGVTLLPKSSNVGDGHVPHSICEFLLHPLFIIIWGVCVLLWTFTVGERGMRAQQPAPPPIPYTAICGLLHYRSASQAPGNEPSPLSHAPSW